MDPLYTVAEAPYRLPSISTNASIIAFAVSHRSSGGLAKKVFAYNALARKVLALRLKAGDAVRLDAGTALTLDYVSGNGVHLGGSIAPGLNLMLDSLTRNTARLYLDRVQPTNGIATNTASAISTGCIDALIGGIERALNNFSATQNEQPQWLITGGGAAQIMELCQVKFRHVPDLVLQGLALAAEPDL